MSVRHKYQLEYWNDCDHCWGLYGGNQHFFTSMRATIECAETIVRCSPMRIRRDGALYLVKDPFYRLNETGKSNTKWTPPNTGTFVSRDEIVYDRPMTYEDYLLS